MKMHCDIIQDLLPNYMDKICSDETNKAVEEHFVECDSCKNKCQAMSNKWMELVVVEPKEIEEYKKDFIFKKTIKKVKRRLIITVLATVLILIPIVGMGVNQKRGDGISFTSLVPVIKTRMLMSDLKNGKYEEALKYVDLEKNYYGRLKGVNRIAVEKVYEYDPLKHGGEEWFDLIETINGNYYLDYSMSYRIPQETFDNEYSELVQKSKEDRYEWFETFLVPFEEYKEYGKEYFINNMQEWEKEGNKITEFKFVNAYMVDNQYQIEYKVSVKWANTNEVGRIIFFVQDGKITFGGVTSEKLEVKTGKYSPIDDLSDHLKTRRAFCIFN
jgi:hypothetical protein